VKSPIRLLALDIDGTLLNPEFQISPVDMAALRRARAEGVEVVVVTGRRHTFALPIVQQLGFDLWVISSNGASTRSLAGETFHRDLLPCGTCLRLCNHMREFRGNTVLTFDTEAKGAIVLEHMNELNVSIQRWLERTCNTSTSSYRSRTRSPAIQSRPCFVGRLGGCSRLWTPWRPAA
jgi:hydroxymethylpyrimidine pyrophosphatase-like HAD family hydrolase